MAFATNNTPWGKSGQKIENKFMPVEDVMKASGLDWEVALEDCYLSDGTLVDKAKVSRRTDNGVQLGIVGNRYQTLQNAEAFKWFAPFVEAKTASIENVGTFYNGKVIFVQAKLETPSIEIVQNDPVDAFLTILHSHDGSTALTCHLGVTRLFCTNQMKMFKSDNNVNKFLKMKHTKNLNISLEKVRETISVAERDFITTCEGYKKLASVGINKKDLEKYVKIVFAKKDEEQAETVRAFETIEEIYETGIEINKIPHSPYRMYSAVSEYLTWHSGRDNSENRLHSLWNGINNQINQKALDVAMDFVNR